jgi:hypothetical protein
MTPDDWEKLARWRDEALQANLGRLRLGAEPIEEQVRRQRRATWALTVIMTILGFLFFSLFTGFGRPDVGAVLACVLVAPILIIVWREYFQMAKRAQLYLNFTDSFERPERQRIDEQPDR